MDTGHHHLCSATTNHVHGCHSSCQLHNVRPTATLLSVPLFLCIHHTASPVVARGSPSSTNLGRWRTHCMPALVTGSLFVSPSLLLRPAWCIRSLVNSVDVSTWKETQDLIPQWTRPYPTVPLPQSKNIASKEFLSKQNEIKSVNTKITPSYLLRNGNLGTTSDNHTPSENHRFQPTTTTGPCVVRMSAPLTPVTFMTISTAFTILVSVSFELTAVTHPNLQPWSEADKCVSLLDST